MPMPATIPAPGAAPSYIPCAASGASSRNSVPGSQRPATRSRAVSLPRPRWRSTAFSPPPARTRSSSASSSAISSRCFSRALSANCINLTTQQVDKLMQFGGGCSSRRVLLEGIVLWVPLDRSGDEGVGGERAAEDLLGGPRRLEQLAQVDPGLDPHLVQHRDQVLAGDVAGRAGRDRAAAELAEARLEGVDADLQRRQHVGQRLAAGVVEVGGAFDLGQLLGGTAEELADLGGVRHPGGVAEPDLDRAGGG